ncbi:MAG: polysaccharide biosynthesis C-terminal domain-containing protein [Balneolaceae bacterium]|nr:polysaccharide biosynthesis C-terminal domain-containing protein [Balneolaceae bacterium]
MDILPPEYHSQWVIIIIGVAKLIDMATGVNGQIILHSKHYRFDLYTMIFLVILTVATNYLLIPIYGILGAAIATALSILVYNLIKCIFVWITFSMQPFHWSSLAVLAIAAICLSVVFPSAVHAEFCGGCNRAITGHHFCFSGINSYVWLVG